MKQNKKDTYLSIDMDFWMQDCNLTDTESFLKTVKNIGIAPTIVLYHHELTKYINNVPNITRLINMDYHSDVADIENLSESEFNEGTWINYVHLNNGNDKYIWNYPLKKCPTIYTGYCHVDSTANPFSIKNQHKNHWNHIVKKYGIITNNEIKRIAAIGICLSPNWTYFKNKDFVKLLYLNGLMNNSDYTKYVNYVKSDKIISDNKNCLNKKEEYTYLLEHFNYIKLYKE